MEKDYQKVGQVERLVGEQLDYIKPIPEGWVIKTSLGIELKFDREWPDGGTDWVTLDSAWVIRANAKGSVTAADPLG